MKKKCLYNCKTSRMNTYISSIHLKNQLLMGLQSPTRVICSCASVEIITLSFLLIYHIYIYGHLYLMCVSFFPMSKLYSWNIAAYIYL